MVEILQNPKFKIKLSEIIDQDWFKIGIFLNIEEHNLESIKSDSAFPKQEEKAREMIKKWFAIEKNPTLQKLKEAITNIPNHHLCKKVEDLASELSTMFSVLPPVALNTGTPNYTFDSNSCGLCVILCNTKFKSLPDRYGANKDVVTLSETFSKLNFKVKTEENKSRNQMFQIIRKCGNEKDVNCFVCFISSHGQLETVFGIDEEPLTFEEMRSAIGNNPHNLLANKPKIFFIDACQVITSSLSYSNGNVQEQDYCFSVSTTPGHMSWRSSNGTFYLKALCRVINNLLEKNEQISLMDILFQLNSEMGNAFMLADCDELNVNICNIAYNTLRGIVHFEKKGKRSVYF
ncbi:caspase-7-like [Hydra vulgaris]|uniref:Caspase-7-like n=1 Tax=Hydra vulgaris TaxID=6087 RepID=A0ABM4B2X5_HYDVU